MYEAKKWGWMLITDILEAIVVKIHIGACDECRQKYYAVLKHMKELEKDAEKVPT